MMMRSHAGRLRDQCTFSKRDRAGLDQFGNPVTPGWIKHSESRGELIEMPGRDVLIKNTMQSRDRAKLRVRDTAAAREIRADDRVRIRNRTWTIRGIGQEELTPRFLMMMLEVVPNAR